METILKDRLTRSQSSPNLYIGPSSFDIEVGDNVFSLPDLDIDQLPSELEDIHVSSDLMERKVCTLNHISNHYVPLKPALLGSGLIGIAFSSFMFILPNVLCKFPNLLFSSAYIVAAFCTPLIFATSFQTNQRICQAVILSVFLLILAITLQLNNWLSPIFLILFAPVIALVQDGSLNLSHNLNRQRKHVLSTTMFAGKYLLASRGWPTLIVSMFFIMTILLTRLDKNNIEERGQIGNQSNKSSSMLEHSSSESCSNGFYKSKSEAGISGETLLFINMIFLICVGLVYLMILSSLATSKHLAKSPHHLTSVNNGWKRFAKNVAKFYVCESKIHLITPMGFFMGLQEAFMTRDFIHGIVGPRLGLAFICYVLMFVGIGRLLMAWVASQIGKIASTYFELFFGGIFQLGLLVVFINWSESLTDSSLVFALGFIWGCSSMAWEFLILSHSDRLFGSQWHNSSSIISFYKSFGMAVMYSLDRNFESINLRAYFNLACFSAAVIATFVLHRNLDRWSASK